MTSPIYHGGNLDLARARFGEPADGWLDLSTRINPVAYPIEGLMPEDWTRLPSREAEREVEEIAAKAYGFSDARRLMVTPGTQAVIQALPSLLKAKAVAILGFTYQEHAACWRGAGARVRVIDTLDGLDDVDALVVVNPNNPDGRIMPAEALLAAGERVVQRGGIVIVDEAFMDVLDPGQSLLPLLPPIGYVVLRSVGKTWGLAGLRLGFVAGPQPTIETVRRFFGPWSVSGPALKLGARALADTAWLEATRVRLKADCAALDRILIEAGLTIVGGTPLFRLARHDAATAIFERLGRTGILVRPFPDRADWLRFGIPSRDADRARLKAALIP